MQLKAQKVSIGRTLVHDLAVRNALVAYSVVVVGHQQFALAQQLPIVSVRSTVVAVVLIDHRQAVGPVLLVVIGEIGRSPHPALTCVVDPGLAIFDRERIRLMHQVDGANQIVGAEKVAQVREQATRHALVEVLVVDAAVVKTDLERRAVRTHHKAVEAALDTAPQVAQQVVGDGLQAVAGFRVRHRVAHSTTPATAEGPLGVDRRPVRGIDRHAKGRLTHQQLLQARRDLLAVALQRAGIHRVKRLFVSEGIHVTTASLPGRGRFALPANPSRDGARRIARPLCSGGGVRRVCRECTHRPGAQKRRKNTSQGSGQTT